MTPDVPLIFPRVARLAPLDPASSSYDSDFREVVGERAELAPVDVVAQVEVDSWDDLRQLRGGDSPKPSVRLVMHRAAMARAGHINAGTGEVLVPKVGDRLASVHELDAGRTLVVAVPTPPGLYCVGVGPVVGLGRGILVASFEGRDLSSAR